MLINCPNCGAPLTSDGYCNYCKTKVRYANHLEIINDDIMRMPDVEILLIIQRYIFHLLVESEIFRMKKCVTLKYRRRRLNEIRSNLRMGAN